MIPFLKNILYLVIFSITFFFNFSHSYSLNPFDQVVYEKIIEICSSENKSLEIGMRFVESMKYSLNTVKELVIDSDVTGIKNAVRDRGLSSEMASILDSHGLYLALKDCYPNSENDRDRLALFLILADTLGRGVGTIQGVTAAILSGRVLSLAFTTALNTLKFTRYGKTLSNLGSGKPKLLIVGGATGLVAIGTIFTMKNEKLKDKSIADKEALELIRILDAHAAQIYLRSEIIKNGISNNICELINDTLELKNSYLELLMKSPEMIRKKYFRQKMEIVQISYIRC